MKKVLFVIRDPDINKVIGDQVELEVDEGASVVDVIKRVDELILAKSSCFPVKGCRSLLHLTYHPTEHRFYRHAALTAYSPAESFVDLKADVNAPLPKGAVVVLALTICSGEWEEIVDYGHG